MSTPFTSTNPSSLSLCVSLVYTKYSIYVVLIECGDDNHDNDDSNFQAAIVASLEEKLHPNLEKLVEVIVSVFISENVFNLFAFYLEKDFVLACHCITAFLMRKQLITVDQRKSFKDCL